MSFQYKHKNLWRVGIASAVLLALYSVSGFLLMPLLLERNLPQYLEHKLERKVSVGIVRVNPFLLTLELSEVVVEGVHGHPLMASKRLFVDLGFTGLFRRAWMVDELTLEGLSVHVVLEPDGKLNIIKLASRLSSDTAAGSGPLALIFGEVSVPAASMEFTDLTGSQPASVTLRSINLQASGLSTQSEDRGEYQMSATLPDGGAVEWRGELSMAPVLAASGQFQVRGLTAATVWPFVRDELLGSELQASASLSGRYVYDAPKSLQLEDVAAELSNVSLVQLDTQKPILKMQRIAATGGKFDLVHHSASLATLRLQAGQAVVSVANDRTLNWTNLIASSKKKEAVLEAAPTGGVSTENSSARTSVAPAAELLNERKIISGVKATAEEQNSAASYSRSDATAVQDSDWKLAIGNLQLDHVALSYIDHSRQQPLAVSIGQLGGRAQLLISGGREVQVVATDVDAQLQKVSLKAPKANDAPIMLESAQIQKGQFDLLGKFLAAQQLRIEGGQIQVVRQQDGVITALDLLGVGQEKVDSIPIESGSLPDNNVAAWRYDIAELSVKSIGIALEDRSTKPVVGYDLQLQSLTASNVASAGKTPTPFSVVASVQQGGTLAASGTVTAKGVVQGQVKIDQLALSPLWPLAKRSSGLVMTSGPLSLTGRVRYAPAQQSPPKLEISEVAFTLPQVVVRRPGLEQPLLAMQRIEASGGRLNLGSRDVVVERLNLQDGQVRAVTQEGRGLGWTTIENRFIKGTSPASAPAAAAWNIQLNALRLDGVGVHYADLNRPSPIAIDVHKLSGSVKLKVKAGGAPMQVAAQELDAKLQQIAVTVGASDQPVVTIDSSSIAQGSFNLLAQTVGATEIVLSGGGARVLQTADGQIPLLSLFTSVTSDPVLTQAQLGAADEAREWRYNVGALRANSFEIAYANVGFEPELSIDGTLQASVMNLANDKPSSFDATFDLNQGGAISATGIAAARGENVQAQVEVAQVVLAPLRPLLQRFAALTLESGAVSASVQVRYRVSGADQMHADGTVQITDLLMNEAWSGERFLAWKQLDADRVALDFDARRLTVKEVTVHEPGVKIVISKEHDVNITRVFKPFGQTGAGGESPSAEQTTIAADAPDFEFLIERVRLLKGEVDYADLSLVLPFSTKVTELNGSIVGISSDRKRRADVKASGVVQPYGSANVEGSIALIEPQHFTDLHVEFKNVLVPPLSPYTATFAGHKVVSGKLWLDLNYKVQDSMLLGKNEIRLANFTLGEKVEAPNAIGVPLKLAVALLTDSKGEIKLSVPVRGDLDNPHFSVSSAVTQAVGNVLRRVISAPFRALGKLFGRDADSLASIDFQPGSARLAPEEREKLDALARALSERPRLQLVVSAPYDPQGDERILKRELARRQLSHALGTIIPRGEDPGPIAYDDPSTRRALEQLLQNHAGNETLSKPDAKFGKASGEFYQELFARLASSQTLGESSIQLLAIERARAIASYLQQRGVQPKQLQTGRIAPVSALKDGSVSAQLQVATDGSKD